MSERKRAKAVEKTPGSAGPEILDHETVALEAQREKRRSRWLLVLRFCLYVAAALVIEVLLGAYENLLEREP